MILITSNPCSRAVSWYDESGVWWRPYTLVSEPLNSSMLQHIRALLSSCFSGASLCVEPYEACEICEVLGEFITTQAPRRGSVEARTRMFNQNLSSLRATANIPVVVGSRRRGACRVLAPYVYCR